MVNLARLNALSLLGHIALTAALPSALQLESASTEDPVRRNEIPGPENISRIPIPDTNPPLVFTFSLGAQALNARAIAKSFQQFYDYASTHPLDPIPETGIQQQFKQGDSQLIVANPCRTLAFSTLVAAKCGRAIERWMKEHGAFDHRMYWISLQTPEPNLPVVGMFNVEPNDNLEVGLGVDKSPGSEQLCKKTAANSDSGSGDIGSAITVERF